MFFDGIGRGNGGREIGTCAKIDGARKIENANR